MSTSRQRLRFSPSIAGSEGRDAANAAFFLQVRQFDLRYRCEDCVYVRPSDGACSVGWPNPSLRVAGVPAIDDDGVPVFCKAFEPLEPERL